jgi:hypothetical protein
MGVEKGSGMEMAMGRDGWMVDGDFEGSSGLVEVVQVFGEFGKIIEAFQTNSENREASSFLKSPYQPSRSSPSPPTAISAHRHRMFTSMPKQNHQKGEN